MSRDHNDLVKSIEEISKEIIRNKGLISNGLLTDIQVFSNEIREKIEATLEEDRLLRIGIVGEVKAGKSSFLNALIFNGKKILPEAPTPMTAALTKISYSKTLKAEVNFYNETDWDTIEEFSRQYKEEYRALKEEYIQSKERKSVNPYGFLKSKANNNQQKNKPVITEEEIKRYVNQRISAEKKGCNELVRMVEDRGIDVYKYFGEKKTIEGVGTLDDLIGKLNEYVGAKGALTPIVKNTDIYMDLETLKGIEVIDTPGTNDPIVSRGIVTRKYLSKCDAVFLLSYAGQFMKAQDVEFIVSTLPAEGIRRGILVGSKFDSALLDDNKSGQDFKKALINTKNNLIRHSTSVIKKEIKNNPDNITLETIEKSMPPELISAMAYIIATKDESELNSKERHLINTLKNRYPSYDFNDSFLKEFSNIDRIKKKHFNNIKEDKKQILENKCRDLVREQTKKFQALLNSIYEESSMRLDNLMKVDKKQLEEKYNSIISNIKSTKSDINTIFSKEIIRITKSILKLKYDIEYAQHNYGNIDIKSDVETSSNTERHGFLWLKKRTVTETTTYYYANVNQAIDNLQRYTLDIKKSILDQFDNIIDIERIRKELKEAIISIFDLKDSSFNEKEILNPIDIAINRLTIPKIDIDGTKYESMIANTFAGSVVKGDGIHDLERKQSKVLSMIYKDVSKMMDKETNRIKEVMKEESNTFVDKIVYSLEDTLSEIKSQLDNKEKYIKDYKKLILEIEEYKKI